MCVYIYIYTHTHKIGAKFINFNIMPNHMKLRKTHESRTGETVFPESSHRDNLGLEY